MDLVARERPKSAQVLPNDYRFRDSMCVHMYLTGAMDCELFAPHELVDELGNQLFRVLVRAVYVVSSRNHHRQVERPIIINDSKKEKKNVEKKN